MNKITVIMPGHISEQLESMVEAAVGSIDKDIIYGLNDLPDLKNKKIIFAAELNNAGTNIKLLEIFSELFERSVCEEDPDPLSGSSGALLIHSPGELYTKSASQNIIFLANQLGCEFLGHPVVEAAGNLENLKTWQKRMDMPLHDICRELSKKLGERLIAYAPKQVVNPNIVALHSSYRKTSNTLELWHMASKNLDSCSITELHVENGDVLDCKGCSYKTCTHYSMQNSCFYGGVMVKDILPAVQKADAVVWICPNYNDALSANLTAVINRLTALYRTSNFYSKTMFSVIVSGNSGSDSVAKQLIGALNINKGFRLPPHFAITAVANDTGEIKKVMGIKEKARDFARNIISQTMA